MILMAYGSPDRLSDVPAYYADIRGGRPVGQELLDDLVARYRALGIDDSDDPSLLNSITEETRAALQRELGIPVFTGMRHWNPRIAAAVDDAVDLGHDALVGLVLAPHWSVALDRQVRGAVRRGGRRSGRNAVRGANGGRTALRRAARAPLP